MVYFELKIDINILYAFLRNEFSMSMVSMDNLENNFIFKDIFTHKEIRAYWLCCLNNSFHCLNNTIRIFITLFHLHVFSQYLNNVTRTTLPNGLGHMFLNNNKNAKNIMHSYNNCFNLWKIKGFVSCKLHMY